MHVLGTLYKMIDTIIKGEFKLGTETLSTTYRNSFAQLYPHLQ